MLRFAEPDTQCFVVLDLEWNQRNSRTNHRIPHEIIEIGAVKLDCALRVLDEIKYIVKPAVYPALDKHIREVTGIEPEELENGLPFKEAFAAFSAWCGPHCKLVTWGRDDYPVLLRNTRFYQLPLEFRPPLNVQMLFSHLMTEKPLVQVGLSSAMEQLALPMDLPAHRALNDALYTAQIMARLQKELDAAPSELIGAIQRFNAEEDRLAQSNAISVPTGYINYDDLLKDETLMTVHCPVCGGETESSLDWFDSGHGRFMMLCACAEHGTVFAQMHFKRQYNKKLIVHQRICLASDERIGEVEEKYQAARRSSHRQIRPGHTEDKKG